MCASMFAHIQAANGLEAEDDQVLDADIAAAIDRIDSVVLKVKASADADDVCMA